LTDIFNMYIDKLYFVT